MKSSKIFGFAAVLLSLVFVSCTKDDDDNVSNDNANEITIGNVTYAINSSFRTKGEFISDGVYEHDVYLLGEGLSFDTNGNISGVGSMVYANIYTDSENTLTNGTYEYPPFGEALDVFSIRFVTAGVELDFNDPNGTNPDDISNGSTGTVTISGSGSNTQVVIDITATNANQIKATYTGDFAVVD